MNAKTREKVAEIRSRLAGAARAYGAALAPLLGRAAGRGRTSRRIVVWEQGPKQWRILEADIDSGTTSVIRTQTCQSPASERAAGGGAPSGDGTILLVGSRRLVCRELEVPDVPSDELATMLALRLESELPYGASEAAWAFKRLSEDRHEGMGRVALLAVPGEDVAEAEAELRAGGRACQLVECREAALAQLAVSVAPDERDVGIVAIERADVLLVIVHAGSISYSRSLGEAPPDSEGGTAAEGLERLAGEVAQSLQHHAARTGRSPVGRLLVVGERALAGAFVQVLADHAGLPAELARPPDEVRMAETAGPAEEVLLEFAACMGVALAASRRHRHMEAAAPPLRVSEAYVRSPALRRRLALAALILVLLAAVVGSAFYVRSAKVRAATGAVTQAQELLRQEQVLAEEVSILQREHERRRSVLDLLLALTEVLPDGTVIKDLTIGSKNEVTILGKAGSVEAASQAATALDASDRFENAHLSRVAQEKEGLMFRLTCDVRRAGGGPR